MNYDSLITTIANAITTNGNNEITGAIMRNVLSAMVASLGSGYQFVGFASPTTNPGTPDQRVFYIAFTAGTYTNFGGIQVSGLTFLYWDSSWHAQAIPGGSGGSVVTLSNVATNGTRIVTITIDGVATDIKAPTSGQGGSVVSLSNLLTQGTRIATLTIDGVAQDIKAPAGGDSVAISNLLQTGTRIAVITVNGVEYWLYAPTSGQGGSIVSISNLSSNGTRIATLTIDGIGYDIKAVLGDSVSISNLLQNGTRIATLTIDGTAYQIYVPAASLVSISGLLQSGTTIATINIDGTDYAIKAPSGGDSVAISNLLASGNRVATVTINGAAYDILIPGKTISARIGGTTAAPTLIVDLGDGVTAEVAIPIADASHAGIVSTTAQTFAGAKTFDRIYMGNSQARGAYVEWDDTNRAWKFVGDFYATGDVAAMG